MAADLDLAAERERFNARTQRARKPRRRRIRWQHVTLAARHPADAARKLAAEIRWPKIGHRTAEAVAAVWTLWALDDSIRWAWSAIVNYSQGG